MAEQISMTLAHEQGQMESILQALHVPEIAIGHRWSAAFPLLSSNSQQQQQQQQQLHNTSLDSRSTSHTNLTATKPVHSASIGSSNRREELLAAHGAQGHCYVHPGDRLVACGDYFHTAFAGRIEGAALSALHAAEALRQICSPTSTPTSTDPPLPRKPAGMR